MARDSWIGCDFDGSLALYQRGDYKKYGHAYLGDPILPMVSRIKAHLAKGQTVKVVTARVADSFNGADKVQESREAIELWCEKHLGQKLEVTCQKDGDMWFLYDDRAVAIETNTGKIVGASSHIGIDND